MIKAHSFHIPVMGLAFTIDSPVKVAQYGIDSVISVGDDILLEKLRKMYCELFEIPYQEITVKIEDFRAKRIESYLNLMLELAEKKFDELKNITTEKSDELKKYFSLLPDSSTLKQEFKSLTGKYFNVNEIKSWVNENLSMGSIDINIMTKLDKPNYKNGELLPGEYNDAHASVRGFANSNLHSSIIFSAGMNPRLYGYMENFDDFYPDANGHINKKIVLKVSDYRSAFIQGKFLAKKGLWVSEYRIESGLNCGGHAFATDGYLMGPILAEFRDNRQELIDSVYEILCKALEGKDRVVPENPLDLRVTAQGGVCSEEEHQFLIEEYKLDSVGWGTPFLLVPEATTVDDSTLDQLVSAREENLYLSGISPLGIPFNNLRGNTKDLEKSAWIDEGRPGSSCPKRYLISNNEFTGDKYICTASRQFQRLKIKELDTKGLSTEAYQDNFDKITEKACLCVGLGTTALLKYNLNTKLEGEGVSICPGPNLAYFSKKMTLKEITDHIYGRSNVITRTDRPNMFVKELNIYLDYLQNIIDEASHFMNKKQEKRLVAFVSNLKDGISYYKSMFSTVKNKFEDKKSKILSDLEGGMKYLQVLNTRIEELQNKK